MNNTSTCHFNNIHMFGYMLISKQVTQLHMHCFHHSSDLVDPIQESSPFLLNKMLSRVIVLSLPVILSFTHTHTHCTHSSVNHWLAPPPAHCRRKFSSRASRSASASLTPAACGCLSAAFAPKLVPALGISVTKNSLIYKRKTFISDVIILNF